MSRPRRAPLQEYDELTRVAEVPGSLPLPDVAGCTQHTHLTIWLDPTRQRMCITAEWIDEWSEPGTLHHHRFLGTEGGPFTAAEDLDAALEAFARYTRRALRLR